MSNHVDDRPAEALDHVVRVMLPWRTDSLTECGKQASTVKNISRDELAARIKKHGQQRTAFTVCMTCCDRTRYAQPWAEEPEAVLEREIRRVQGKPGDLRRELLAVAALIDAHRDEFDAYVTGLAGAPSLAEHRRNRRFGGPRG